MWAPSSAVIGGGTAWRAIFCKCPLRQLFGRLTAFPLLSSSPFACAFSLLDTSSCAFVLHTHTYISHHLFLSWLFFFRSKFFTPLRVHRSIRRRSYIPPCLASWKQTVPVYLVPCLRDLRDDIEARQDVLHGQLMSEDHRPTAVSYRTILYIACS